jgi:hypothetical protein
VVRWASAACVGGLVCLAVSSLARVGGERLLAAGGVKPPDSLPSLLALPSSDLARVDIAVMNLLCEQRLPGAEKIGPAEAARMLDQWAERVRVETERHAYRFERSPAEFEHSNGYFPMVMLAVVLAEDCGVHYRPERRIAPEAARMGDGFFSEAKDVFLGGLVGPRREGTCSSLPVLQVAVGRRLGYPLKLVTTKGHLFVRWEGAGERFNVEAAGRGVNRFPDEYYLRWPYVVSEQERTAEGYLRSLAAAEELAVFLSIRRMCCLEAGRNQEAGEAFAEAARRAPGCEGYRRMEAMLRGREHPTERAATWKAVSSDGNEGSTAL